MYDDLVKRLRRCEQFRCRECEYEQVMGCRAKLNEEAVDAIEELSAIREEQKAQIIAMAAEDKPRWIPVTERLPEEYVNVLCHLRSLDRQSRYYSIDHLMEDGCWWKATNSWRFEVTHWMPLPQPPEEGE